MGLEEDEEDEEDPEKAEEGTNRGEVGRSDELVGDHAASTNDASNLPPSS